MQGLKNGGRKGWGDVIQFISALHRLTFSCLPQMKAMMPWRMDARYPNPQDVVEVEMVMLEPRRFLAKELCRRELLPKHMEVRAFLR